MKAKQFVLHSLLLLVVSQGIVSCVYKSGSWESGSRVVQSRQLKGFDKIEVYGSPSVYFFQADVFSVNVKGPEDKVDKIITTVEDGTLIIRNKGKMNILGTLPSECIIKSLILGGRRNILITSYNMCDAHKMVINDVCKVICRITVGLNEDHVVKLGVVYSDVSVKLVVECGGSLIRNVLTDNVWLACSEVCLDLLFGKVETVLIVNNDLLAFYSLLKALKTLLVTEAVVSLAFFNKLLCILKVDA